MDNNRGRGEGKVNGGVLIPTSQSLCSVMPITPAGQGVGGGGATRKGGISMFSYIRLGQWLFVSLGALMLVAMYQAMTILHPVPFTQVLARLFIALAN